MARKPKDQDMTHPKSWPAEMEALARPLTDLKPYPRNTRTHPRAQIEVLASLLKKFGPDQPIVVDESWVILKGHGRHAAAEIAGFVHFPVVRRVGLSEVDKTALRIADNQVALLAGWDAELMRVEINMLQTADFDMQLLAFPEAELRSFGMPGAPGAGDPEEVPAIPKAPIVRTGDLWMLGKHRVLCGDATRPESWKALYGNQRAAMVFTDPPYGVSYQGDRFGVIEGDRKRRDELYKMLLSAMKEMTRYTTERAAFYIWHASSTREDFAQAMKAAGIAERQYLMWVKPSIVFGHADYQWQHEPCFYASKADHPPMFYGQRAESTVWHVQISRAKDTAAMVGNGVLLLDGEGGALYIQNRGPKNKKLRQIRVLKDSHVYLSGADRQDGTVWEVARDGNHEHPTQKPIELARRAIENSSTAGEIVGDPFLGSATTLIGAELTARRCFGMDIDPAYCEVGIRRWEKYTGQKATMDGQTLEQLAGIRRVRSRAKRTGAANTPPPAE